MNSSIHGIREIVVTNPPMHDGLMLLIYELIMIHSMGKYLDDKAELEAKSKDVESQ